MKRWTTTILSAAALTMCALPQISAADIKVGIVNFRECFQESQVGKQEQQQFEEMRGKLEAMLEEKEQKLAGISEKFSDPDYVDGLSPEAEREIKEEYARLHQELAQLQNQYVQVLNQANARIVQKVSQLIEQASASVAEDKQLDLILNEDSTFYAQNALSVTADVIKKLDEVAQDLGEADTTTEPAIAETVDG